MRPSRRDHAIDRRLSLLQAELEAGEAWSVDGTALPAPQVPAFSPPRRLVAVPDPDDPDVMWTEEIEEEARLRTTGPLPGSTGAPATHVSHADETAIPLAIPTVGRHASRRTLDLLPESLRGRVTLTPAMVALVAVTVALAIAVTAWFVVRDQARVAPTTVRAVSSPLATPALGAAPGAAGVPAAATLASAPTATGQVTVDVAGKVRHPGIVTLPAGSRVVDALEAAGGARRGVDLTSLNQARLLVDGEQLLVGVAAAAPAGVTMVPGSAPSGALVSLNSADETTLETLPGVGPVTAQSIIGWREAHGGFSSVNELLEVDGIGDATLAKLSPLVTL